MDSTVVRRPCFIEEDDGLASLADVEAGVSGNNNGNNSGKQYCNSICHSTQICSTRGGFRTGCMGSPRSRSWRFYDARYEEGHLPHFLAACFLCKKQLGNNRDIFMYRGDTAFCSEECRQEQIDMEESKEKDMNLSSSMKALRKKQQDQKNKKPTSPNRGYNTFHAGAVAAA